MALVYVIVAYLSGSIPFGWIIAKFKTGKDLRDVGSGATGATNTLRATGFRLAVVAGLLDVLKASFPTLLIIRKNPDARILHTVVGSATVAGHTRSVFLGFKGGKAVSPSAGVLLALATKEKPLLLPLLPAISVFVLAIALTRGIVSVGSLLGTATAAVYSLHLAGKKRVSRVYSLWVVATTVYIWILHRANIERLLKGKENRISLGS